CQQYGNRPQLTF
nr:immunoglobulin light chain junction region [Macaca mulatta]